MGCKQLRGSSLLEMLISLALFSLILGLTALLLGSYQRLVRQGRERLALSQAAVAVLEDLGQELRESVTVDSLGSDLRFRKLLSQASGRLPDAFPTPPPAPLPAFDPHQPAHLVEVGYRIEADGHLWRRVEAAGGPAQSQKLISSPGRFQVQREPEGTLSATLELRIDQRVEALRLEIYRPLP